MLARDGCKLRCYTRLQLPMRSTQLQCGHLFTVKSYLQCSFPQLQEAKCFLECSSALPDRLLRAPACALWYA